MDHLGPTKLQLLFVLLFVGTFLVPTITGLPTLYQYYSQNENGTFRIKSGLVANNSDHFMLNGHPFVIFGGSFHYFRVMPQNWRITLQKFKASGLNTVQLYIPWNLHEDIPGSFDFVSQRLNLEQFLREIKRAELFAIVRPGPYICAEWEMGGLPSWLLRDPKMKLRSNYGPYVKAVTRYYRKVLDILVRYQFSVNGGPIIALQLENEYFGPPIEHSFVYLKHLHSVVQNSGFKQLLFCSDSAEVARNLPLKKELPSMLQTANLNDNALELLSQLRHNQTNRPVYVSEFWPGWFDQWGDQSHHRYNISKFRQEVFDILFSVNGSINFYMFVGGTNFGFMNGARTVTSYDYDAPLSESGFYTEKYWETKRFYRKLVRSGRLPDVRLPPIPAVTPARDYGTLRVDKLIPISLNDLLRFAPKTVLHRDLVPMELLNLTQYNNVCGQRFGFVLYRIELDSRWEKVSKLQIKGTIADRALILFDGVERALIKDGYNSSIYRLKIDPNWLNPNQTNHHGHHWIDILVENMGRLNYGTNLVQQLKGVQGQILFDNKLWNGNITVYSLDFQLDHIESIRQLLPSTLPAGDKFLQKSPTLYRTILSIVNQSPADTYLLLPGWTKGNVFVNGFNLGRYYYIGPQRTMFIPAPLLRQGENYIDIFELHRPGTNVQLIDYPILEWS